MIFRAVRDIWGTFKEYTDQALVAAFIAVVFYVVITVITYVIRTIKGKRPYSIWYVLFKTCLFALLGIYTSYLGVLTILGRESGSRPEGVFNLDPFSTIISNGRISLEVFENFLLFVPLGILIPWVWKYFRGIFRTTVIGFFVSLAIETVQIVTRRGYFDVDDVILNTLGALVGYLIFGGMYDGFMGVKRRIITDAARKCRIEPPLGMLYQRFALRNSLVLFIYQLVPVYVWYNVIMGFSSDDAGKSGGASMRILEMIYSLLSGNNSSSFQSMVDRDAVALYEKIIRKAAHMFEYAVLAVLIWAMIYSLRKVYRIISYCAALIVVGMVGMIDETNQATIVGRTGTIKDVAIDATGAVIILFVIAAVTSLARKHYITKYKISR